MGPTTPQPSQPFGPASMPAELSQPGMAPTGAPGAPAGDVLPSMPMPGMPGQPGAQMAGQSMYAVPDVAATGAGAAAGAAAGAEMGAPVQPMHSVGGMATGVAGMDTTAVTQAKQLVAQYGNNPFALSNELSRVKSAHLVAEYGIITNPAKN